MKLSKIKNFFKPKLDLTRNYLTDGYNVSPQKLYFKQIPISHHLLFRFLLICTIISLAIIFIAGDMLIFYLKGDKIATITGMIIEFLDNTIESGIFIAVIMIFPLIITVALLYTAISGIGRYIIVPTSNFIMKFIFKPEMVIDKSGKDVYGITKHKFDYDLEEFEGWVYVMTKEGFNLEYYDESEYANMEFFMSVEDYASLSHTFIGSLIRKGAINHVRVLLNNGVKVDERENWIRQCLAWGNFDMVELLVMNNVKMGNVKIGTLHNWTTKIIEFDEKYRNCGLFRLKSIAELMKVHGDLEGYNILSEKIKEMEKG